MVFDTPHHKRTAMRVGHRTDIIHREPVCPKYSRIQCLIRIVVDDFSSKCKAEKSNIIRGRMPTIDAEYRLGNKEISGLFQRFADCALNDRFGRLEMASGLIE